MAVEWKTLVLDEDSRLTDSREWTADTVSQAEAEAGTATDRRAWTAERVKQAIEALAPSEIDTFSEVIAADSDLGDFGACSAPFTTECGALYDVDFAKQTETVDLGGLI